MTLLSHQSTKIDRPSEPTEFGTHFLTLLLEDKFWDYLRGGRYQWPRSLRHRSAGARPLKLWVRISPTAWILVCCECCVYSGRCLYDELLTRPESYRLWCVVVCDLETS